MEQGDGGLWAGNVAYFRRIWGVIRGFFRWCLEIKKAESPDVSPQGGLFGLGGCGFRAPFFARTKWASWVNGLPYRLTLGARIYQRPTFLTDGEARYRELARRLFRKHAAAPSMAKGISLSNIPCALAGFF